MFSLLVEIEIASRGPTRRVCCGPLMRTHGNSPKGLLMAHRKRTTGIDLLTGSDREYEIPWVVQLQSP